MKSDVRPRQNSGDSNRTGDNVAVSVSAVIFDFDGVLADTERLHLRAFQTVFSARAWSLDEVSYFDRYLGYDDKGLVAAFARDQNLTVTAADVRELVDAKSRVFAGYLEAGEVLFSGARECVGALAQEYTLGIASGALHAEIVAILTAAGLIERFTVIIAADDVDECKPSPVPYLAAAAGLRLDPRACVAIEDSTAGLEAARAAGMLTVGVTTTLPRPLLEDGADLIVDSLREISPATVGRLGQRRAL